MDIHSLKKSFATMRPIKSLFFIFHITQPRLFWMTTRSITEWLKIELKVD